MSQAAQERPHVTGEYVVSTEKPSVFLDLIPDERGYRGYPVTRLALELTPSRARNLARVLREAARVAEAA